MTQRPFHHGVTVASRVASACRRSSGAARRSVAVCAQKGGGVVGSHRETWETFSGSSSSRPAELPLSCMQAGSFMQGCCRAAAGYRRAAAGPPQGQACPSLHEAALRPAGRAAQRADPGRAGRCGGAAHRERALRQRPALQLQHLPQLRVGRLLLLRPANARSREPARAASCAPPVRPVCRSRAAWASLRAAA